MQIPAGDTELRTSHFEPWHLYDGTEQVGGSVPSPGLHSADARGAQDPDPTREAPAKRTVSPGLRVVGWFALRAVKREFKKLRLNGWFFWPTFALAGKCRYCSPRWIVRSTRRGGGPGDLSEPSAPGSSSRVDAPEAALSAW